LSYLKPLILPKLGHMAGIFMLVAISRASVNVPDTLLDVSLPVFSTEI